jgi:hypothetical protein
VDESEPRYVSQSSQRDIMVNDFRVSFTSDSVSCVTSSGGGDDFGNEDLSKSVEVNNLRFVEQPFVELSLTTA